MGCSFGTGSWSWDRAYAMRLDYWFASGGHLLVNEWKIPQMSSEGGISRFGE